MKTMRDPSSLRRLLILSVTVAAMTFVANAAALAQPGSGGCQRGRGGPNGGSQSGMPGPNAQGSGYVPGMMPGNMQGYQPVAQSPAQTRQALQANYQAKQQRLRDKKAAIKAANVSRQKPKPTKPSSSSSPTASNSFGLRHQQIS